MALGCSLLAPTFDAPESARARRWPPAEHLVIDLSTFFVLELEDLPTEPTEEPQPFRSGSSKISTKALLHQTSSTASRDDAVAQIWRLYCSGKQNKSDPVLRPSSRYKSTKNHSKPVAPCPLESSTVHGDALNKAESSCVTKAATLGSFLSGQKYWFNHSTKMEAFPATTSSICDSVLNNRRSMPQPPVSREGKTESQTLIAQNHKPTFTAHQIDHQWLRFKLSETFWWMEALGPSFPAPPPVKSQTVCDKTLIWLEVPFNGLGPRHQQQFLSPNYHSLKTSCKRSGPTVKALKPNYMTKAQPPYVPRFVYFTLLSSHIFLMFPFSVLNGRRRHPNRIATSLRLIDSYHTRGLMEGLAISLLKNCSFARPIQSSSFMERTFLQAQQAPRFVIESDAKNVIAAITSETPPLHSKGVIEDINHLPTSFQSLSFRFIPRSENTLADDLAKKAIRSMTSGHISVL